MCYVCCALLLLLSSSILHYIPYHQQSPMPSFAVTRWHQHCRASNPLLLPYQHHKPQPQLSSPLHHIHLHNQWLPPTAAAFSNPLACDVMQCLCLQSTHCLYLLLLLRVMFMCQWYCDPPAGSAAAVAGMWFDWFLFCCRGTVGE
jgi:hypothetical protein